MQSNKEIPSKKNIKYTYAEDEVRLAKLVKPYYDKINSVNKLVEKRYKIRNELQDSSVKNKLQQDIDSLLRINEESESQITIVQFNFIRNNPSSFFSLDRLSLILRRNAESPVICDTISSLFKNLNPNIQNSVSGSRFKLLLIDLSGSKVGSLAPDFNAKDINNKAVSLSVFRNKNYVLLDFWASWCKPCREDIPFLKDIYNAYNKNGLVIIGVSKDDNSSLWKKAIEKDSTQIWRHILVSPNIQTIDSSAITNKYFVYGIPVKVLINKEGIIIGRWSGGGEENIFNLEKLLNKVFNN